MPSERLEFLMKTKTYDAVVGRHELFRDIFGVI